MSADNTIVILVTKRTIKREGAVTINHQPLHNVYRVAHVQAWDTLSWYKTHQPYNLGWYLDSKFKNSEVYLTEAEAIQKAIELQQEIGYVEYGIHTEFTSMFYPGD